jgi:hypothetical protein
MLYELFLFDLYPPFFFAGLPALLFGGFGLKSFTLCQTFPSQIPGFGNKKPFFEH